MLVDVLVGVGVVVLVEVVVLDVVRDEELLVVAELLGYGVVDVVVVEVGLLVVELVEVGTGVVVLVDEEVEVEL